MSSCFSRCLRVPIAMRRFYEQSLWIPQKFLFTNLDLHHGLIAMMDSETGEFVEKTLLHKGSAVRDFYAALEGPVVVGIEATGSMQWFLELLEETTGL